MNSSAEALCSPAMFPVRIEMVPSSRIVSCISAFMSDPLSEQELVLGLHHLLPAHLQTGVVDDFPAVLHAQLVDGGHFCGGAAGFVAFEHGDRDAASTELPPSAPVLDREAEDRRRLLKQRQVPGLEVHGHGVDLITGHGFLPSWVRCNSGS